MVTNATGKIVISAQLPAASVEQLRSLSKPIAV
jgi:hypothetical protein